MLAQFQMCEIPIRKKFEDTESSKLPQLREPIALWVAFTNVSLKKKQREGSRLQNERDTQNYFH